MYIVSKGHSVTLSRQVFTAGKPLPGNRDYSGLERLGIVEKFIPVTSSIPKNEPAIVKITREKVEKVKGEQAIAKKKRKNKKLKSQNKPDNGEKPKKFTVETGG